MNVLNNPYEIKNIGLLLKETFSIPMIGSYKFWDQIKQIGEFALKQKKDWKAMLTQYAELNKHRRLTLQGQQQSLNLFVNEIISYLKQICYSCVLMFDHVDKMVEILVFAIQQLVARESFPPGLYSIDYTLMIQEFQIFFLVQCSSTDVRVMPFRLSCFHEALKDNRKHATYRWPFDTKTSQGIFDVAPIVNSKHLTISTKDLPFFLKRQLKTCFSTIINHEAFHAESFWVGSFAVVGEISWFYDCEANEKVFLEAPIVIRFEPCGSDVHHLCSSYGTKIATFLNQQLAKTIPTLYCSAFLSNAGYRFREMTLWEKAGNVLFANISDTSTLTSCILWVGFQMVQLWEWGFSHFDCSISNVVFQQQEQEIMTSFQWKDGTCMSSTSVISDGLLIDVDDIASIEQFKDKFKSFTLDIQENTSTMDSNGTWYVNGRIIELETIQIPLYALFYPKTYFLNKHVQQIHPACACFLYFLNSVRHTSKNSQLNQVCASLSGQLLTIQTPQDLFYALQASLANKKCAAQSYFLQSHVEQSRKIMPIYDVTVDNPILVIPQTKFW